MFPPVILDVAEIVDEPNIPEPTRKLPAMPVPPSTRNAPVDVVVETVVALIRNVCNPWSILPNSSATSNPPVANMMSFFVP